MYTYRRSLTVLATSVFSEVHGNFQVLVSTTLDDLRTISNGGKVHSEFGYDIGFFSDTTLLSPLDWEVEYYNPTTGQLIAWVLIPSLSNVTNNVFYMGYGDEDLTTFQGDEAGTWTGLYAAYHFPNGTTLSHNDLTSGNNDLTKTGSVIAGTGKVDGCAVFSAVDIQHLSQNSVPSSTITDFNLTAWVKITDDSVNTSNSIVMYNGIRSSNNGYGWGINGNEIELHVGTTVFPTSYRLDENIWYRISFQRDGSNFRLYVNGSEEFVQFAIPSVPGARFRIGEGFIGYIDEPRFGGWIPQSRYLTHYAAENSPGTFVTIGSEVFFQTDHLCLELSEPENLYSLDITTPTNLYSCSVTAEAFCD